MRVAILSAVYPPEPVVSARISRDLALELLGAGHKVSIICPRPTRPFGAAYSPEAVQSSRRAQPGLRVLTVNSFTHPRSGLLGRMWESLSFGKKAVEQLKHEPPVDVIYANTWPMFAQHFAARYAVTKGVPLVLHVQDIYPETLEPKLPRLAGKMTIPLLRAWDRSIAHAASKVITIAERARSRYQMARQLSPSVVDVVYNWQDEKPFIQQHDAHVVANELRIDIEKFTFLYLGSLAPTADVELVIDAFLSSPLPHAQLLIIGDGARKDACVAMVKGRGGMNVQFASCLDPDNVPALQSLADVCLLPLRPGVGVNGVPSKLPAYQLSAKPVIAAVEADTDTALCIQAAKCGWITPPGDRDALANALLHACGTADAELNAMGQNGRKFALQHFSKSAGVQKLASIVLGSARGPQRQHNL